MAVFTSSRCQRAIASGAPLIFREARQIAANVAEAAGPAVQGLMLNSTRLFGVQFLLDAYVACAYPPRIGQEQAIIANPSPLPAALDCRGIGRDACLRRSGAKEFAH